MALADSVPGVSGGTIAFILGFYEKLLESINILTTRDKKNFRKAVSFLIKLMIGWAFGMLCSVSFLTKMFEKNIYFMSSLFIGLTVASIFYIIRSEFSKIEKKNSYLLFSIFGILLVVCISALRDRFSNNGLVVMTNMSLFEYLYLFFTGVMAVSAMVLPGISGSTLLLIFGVYVPIISGLNSIIGGDFSTLGGLVVFIFGVFFGLISSVRIIRRAFIKYRSKMIYFIVGLTAGSIYAIMLGPTTLKVKHDMVGMNNFSILGFIVGVGILIFIGMISRRNKGEKLEKGS
ncbi:putative membrane protein [Peptostreptococcus sp. D1]|nr:putative membrane protein [Peptostreptococcus sp. D1]